MENQEKQKLFEELNLLSIKAKERAKERATMKKIHKCYYTIFSLYKQGIPVYKIAKKANLSPGVVVKLIQGSWHIPKHIIPEIKALGFKICSCCGARIVPIKPVHNTTLTQLCSVCWLSNTNSDPIHPVASHIPVSR